MMARVRTVRVVAALLVVVWLGIMVFYNGELPRIPYRLLTWQGSQYYLTTAWLPP